MLRYLTVRVEELDLELSPVLARRDRDREGRGEREGRSVHEIVSDVQHEISAVATAQGEQLQRDTQGFVESLKKSAPVGSESAISAWNSIFSAANATYESANKAAKQFVATVSTV